MGHRQFCNATIGFSLGGAEFWRSEDSSHLAEWCNGWKYRSPRLDNGRHLLITAIATKVLVLLKPVVLSKRAGSRGLNLLPL